MELTNLVCYDNGGETFDRYTVLVTPPEDRDPYYHDSGLWEGLGLSLNCDWIQGYSQWCDTVPGDHLGKRINFSDLPENVQAHIARTLE